MRVEVAPLPNGGVGPAAREVGLGLALHLEVVVGELAALGQVAHDVEEPVAHAPREVRHLALGALGHLPAHAVVLDLHVVVLRRAAQVAAVQAQAALPVHLAVRRPRLVVVGAHLRDGRTPLPVTHYPLPIATSTRVRVKSHHVTLRRDSVS